MSKIPSRWAESSPQRISTSSDKTGIVRALAVLLWLIIWQVVSTCLDNRLLLVSPLMVFVRLFELAAELSFWQAVAFSLLRIMGGFFLAFPVAVLTALLAHRFSFFRIMLWPLISCIRSVPVASFIILALVWLPSPKLPQLIAYLMVFPILYDGVLQGLSSMQVQLEEMAEIFEIRRLRYLRYIVLPQLFPFVMAGCKSALGLVWKAGIAAEVIAMPRGSIGNRLQQAKVYLDTPDLFAWTLVVVILSILCSRLVLAIMKELEKALLRYPFLQENRMQNPAEPQEKEKEGRKADGLQLTVSHLEKSYDNHIVLDDINLSFKQGESYGLLAPSGYGKTTFLRILMRLEEADSGQITLQPQQRAVFGCCFQENRLIPNLSAAANIALGNPSLTFSQITDALEEVGLKGCERQKVSLLSGGMQRRVALLRALLADRTIVCLDEPFKGLDEANVQRAIDFTGRVCKDRLLILVTHEETQVTRLGAKAIRLS